MDAKLLDSGLCYSDKNDCNVILRDAQGNGLEVLGCAEVSFLLDGYLYYHRFVIVQNLSYPVIIGLDFLDSNPRVSIMLSKSF